MPGRKNLFVRGAAANDLGGVHSIGFPRIVALILLLAGFATWAAEQTAGPGPTNPPVRWLGGGLYEIGGVRLDKTGRTVTFPATVNLREETVEYAVVHKSGKTHESIFRTDARPLDIQLALLLLGLKGAMTNSFGADGKALPAGDKVWIEASWTNRTTRVQYAMEDLVWKRESKMTPPPGEWIYNGSNFSEGAFTAQRDGSIVSIHIDPDALINNPRPGRENDDLHLPNAAKLPPIGTLVEITIRLVGQPSRLP